MAGPAGGRAAVLGAGHAQRLSRDHLRLDGRRAGAPRLRRSLGTFFRDEVAEPLGLDFWIGLPEEHEPRVAPMIPFSYKAASRPRRRSDRHGDRTGVDPVAVLHQRRPGVRAAPTAAKAMRPRSARRRHHQRARPGRNVRAAGAGRRRTLVDRETLARMGEVSVATNDDATLLIPTRFALGFMKSMDNRKRRRQLSARRRQRHPGSAAFGHVGAGGRSASPIPAAGCRSATR